ncbi:MAG: sugar kinase [Verrucomicrobia bacterium]|nr:MAG: sugar kinase [Verrucomicrobiota bacterium]
MEKIYLGIEIGGTKLQAIIGNEPATIRERRRLTVNAAKGGASIRQQIEEMLPELLRVYSVEAIGVGFGGPVDWRSGKIFRSHQIEGWSGFDLAGWLRSLTNKPVAVENDANLGALGEATHGAGVGFSPVVFLTLGSGMGGGLVVDGKIYHGAIPGEAEIGHVLLDRHGTIVEQRCSGWAVDRKIRELKTTAPESLLARLAGESVGGEAKSLKAALAQSDALAQRILDETSDDLAFALSHVVHLFHPEMIILGGGVSLVGEPLRAAVAKRLDGLIMEVFWPGPQINLSKLGEDAIPVGALVLARRALN